MAQGFLHTKSLFWQLQQHKVNFIISNACLMGLTDVYEFILLSKCRFNYNFNNNV